MMGARLVAVWSCMAHRLVVGSLLATSGASPTTSLPAPGAVIDLSGIRSSLSHLRRTEKVTTNHTKANATEEAASAGAAKPPGWAPPLWYDDIPDLHKQMNENTALHDIYVIGKTRTTTTTLLTLSTTAPDWFLMIHPDDVTWEHIVQKLDELRGFSVPKAQYVIPGIPGENPEDMDMEYSDADDVTGRGTDPSALTSPPAGGTHTTMPPTRDRSNPGEMDTTTTAEPDGKTTTDFTTGYTAFDMLDALIKKTEGQTPTTPPPTPPPPIVGWGDHLLTKHTTTTTSSPPSMWANVTIPPVHHLHVPSTREPVPILSFNTTTTGTTTLDTHALTLDGIERVLYLLDQLVHKTGEGGEK